MTRNACTHALLLLLCAAVGAARGISCPSHQVGAQARHASARARLTRAPQRRAPCRHASCMLCCVACSAATPFSTYRPRRKSASGKRRFYFKQLLSPAPLALARITAPPPHSLHLLLSRFLHRLPFPVHSHVLKRLLAHWPQPDPLHSLWQIRSGRTVMRMRVDIIGAVVFVRLCVTSAGGETHSIKAESVHAYAGTRRHMQAYAIIRSAYACSVGVRMHAGTLCVWARAFAHTHTHMQTHAHAYIFMRTHAHAHARVCVRHACYHAADTDQYCQSCPLNTSSAAGSGSRLACVCNAGVLRNPVTLCRRPRLLSRHLGIFSANLRRRAVRRSGAGRKNFSYMYITNGNPRHPSCLLSSVGSSVPFVRARSRVRTA